MFKVDYYKNLISLKMTIDYIHAVFCTNDESFVLNGFGMSLQSSTSP